MASCNRAAQPTGAMEALQNLLVEAQGYPLPVFSRSCRKWFQGTLALSTSTNGYFCELRFDVPGVGLCRKQVHLSTLASMLRDAMARPAVDSIRARDTDPGRRSTQPAESERVEMDPGIVGVGRGAAVARRAVDYTKAKFTGRWMQVVELMESLKLGRHPTQHRKDCGNDCGKGKDKGYEKGYDKRYGKGCGNGHGKGEDKGYGKASVQTTEPLHAPHGAVPVAQRPRHSLLASDGRRRGTMATPSTHNAQPQTPSAQAISLPASKVPAVSLPNTDGAKATTPTVPRSGPKASSGASTTRPQPSAAFGSGQSTVVAQPPPAPLPPPVPAATPPEALDKECTLRELLENEHIVLVNNGSVNPMWLRKSFVDKGKKLVRRQELPKEAVVSVARAVLSVTEAVAEVQGLKRVGVISHAWLQQGHPDPDSQRRGCIGKIRFSNYLFWDFLSLHQMPRSGDEHRHFKLALGSMHVIYGHAKWCVYRLLAMPDGALNSTPYQKRGWCFFETSVAVLAAGEVESIGGDEKNEPTPVPLSPENFEAQVRKLHFTSPNADKGTVAQLYKRIFPKLAQHEEIKVNHWQDDHVRELLEVLPHFTGLKKVTMQFFNYTKGCTEALAKLHEALAARGGALVLYDISVKNWDDGDARALLELLQLGAVLTARSCAGVTAVSLVTIDNRACDRVVSDAVLRELWDAVARRGGGWLRYYAPDGSLYIDGEWIGRR